MESTQHYISGITISFILDNILCLSKTPSLYPEPYMATPIPLSGANCHIYISAIMAEWLCCSKKCDYIIINGVVWSSTPHVAFCFWLWKSPESQSPLPHGVHLVSNWCPTGIYLDSMWTPSAVPKFPLHMVLLCLLFYMSYPAQHETLPQKIHSATHSSQGVCC